MSLRTHNIKIYLVILVALVANPVSSKRVFAQSQEEESTAPKTGAITGRVVNESGQPISHAFIYVTASASPAQPRVVTTDDSGNFQVIGLDALAYSLRVSAPSYINTPREPDSPLPPNYRIGDSVTVSMIKGGVITGTVTSATGEPMVQTGVSAILIRDADGKPPALPRPPIDRLTDDRGVYRLYGLPAGTYLVSAGGRGNYGYANNAYDTYAPTYAPSATRDAAAEIAVRSGEETNSVDIRYRGEVGYAISGAVSGPTAPSSSINITLMQIVNGVSQIAAFSFQQPNSRGFVFYGIADGDYDLTAQSSATPAEAMVSDPLRVTLKGGDLTGINLVLKSLGSISGRVVLESSTAHECRNKRKPLFSETVLAARRRDQNTSKGPITVSNFSVAQASPDKSGDFVLRNLAPGQFSLDARFFAKYWYLQSIERENPATHPLRAEIASRPTDAPRNGISLKFGERVTGLTVTLAGGAGSLRGAVKLTEETNAPAKLYLYLVPAEKENVENVLRFFTTLVQADGTFAFNNLPPGRYWILARLSADNEPQFDAKLRSPEEADKRAQVRRAAEAAKTEIDLKPCQDVIDYQLPLKILSLRK